MRNRWKLRGNNKRDIRWVKAGDRADSRKSNRKNSSLSGVIERKSKGVTALGVRERVLLLVSKIMEAAKILNRMLKWAQD